MRISRMRSGDLLAHVAAEVLEARSLLSGATAVVHQAEHAVAPSAHVQPAALQQVPNVIVQFTSHALTITNDPALSFTVTPVVLKAGARVQFKVSVSGALATDPTVPYSISGTISAKVVSWKPVGKLTEVTLGAPHGSLNVLENEGTGPLRSKLLPIGSPPVLDLTPNGQFDSLEEGFASKTAGKPPILGFVGLFFTS